MSDGGEFSGGADLNGIAIIGMSGRWPGASTPDQFWHNQLAGLEMISQFGIGELEIVNRGEAARNPGYIRARSILENIDMFDAAFFGIYPREAVLMDPQQRLFLECSWEACERAGYDPAAYDGAVGVFGGCSIPTYFLSRICKQPGFIDRFTGDYQAASFPELLGNGLDFISTRVAYKLGLTGPAISMGTACSTSLVAVAQACQTLLTYQCDMALAGGASISLPQKRGTTYIEGGMTSSDGHCRTFDADASGTVFGSGVAVVLLKRLEDAVKDGDPIVAVIKGFAVNNDGSRRVGFTAPSVDGQSRVISQAYALAGIDPDSVGYVEAHGTATPLGDPIEVSALTQAFRAYTDRKQYCTIGTAKTNVGHLDAAAGATGLINAAHIVKHGLFPPTLHFKSPNPKLELESSPFKVIAERSAWPATDGPRRAGVSAFGVGGTNAHVVLEEAPPLPARALVQAPQALVLSARSEAALDAMKRNLAAHLADNRDIDLADVAWTLQSGRRRFSHGLSLVASTVDEAIVALKGNAPERVNSGLRPDARPQLVFLFPGQGAQYVGMGRELYVKEPVFRDTVDACAAILEPLIGTDLRQLMLATNGSAEAAAERLRNTAMAQPAIFTIEYALAALWESFGVKPDLMIGHSVGEFAAATLAGVFSLEDALRLVAERGRLMQDAEPGAMISVRLSEDALRSRIKGSLAISAVNAPKVVVVGGTDADISALADTLQAEGIACRRLVTSHAFHTPMMEPVVDRFRAVIETVRLAAPTRAIVSTVTGRELSAEEATSAAYWARHLREPVRFSDAIRQVRMKPGCALLELGPGNTLSILALQHQGEPQTVAASLGGPGATESDATLIKTALGALWLAGIEPSWRATHSAQRQDLRRVALPAYPFERQRYWLDHPSAVTDTTPAELPIPVAFPAPSTEFPTMQEIVRATPAEKPSTASTGSGGREGRILQAIIDVFEELSGTRIGLDAKSASFLELGFDSLFLTQATRGLQSKIGLKVTFRQLLGQLNTLEALAKYADETLPKDAFAEAAVAAAPVAPSPAVVPTAQAAPGTAAPAIAFAASPATLAGTATAGPIATGAEQLLREQLQVMQSIFTAQIQALRGTPVAAPVIETTAISPIVSAPQAAAAQPAQAPLAVVKSAPEAAAGGAVSALSPFKGSPKSGAAITPEQSAHIARIVERIARRSPKSKAQTQAHRKVLADPRVVTGFRDTWKEMVFPVVANRSKGSRLWDIDGNEYIDLLNGFGPIMFGHRPDFVQAALAEQIQSGFEIGPQTPLAGEIAELFCELTGNERVTFCNTGSEAVMAAFRLARTVTGRDKVVLFSGDYHGMFDEVLVKTGRSPDGTPRANAIAPGIPRASVSNMIVLDYGTPETLEWIRKHADELAAVICEPVQSRRPHFQPVEFLKEVRRITQDRGTALIFDEVVTGFRSHPGGCQALFGIRADMATYGKVVGGGMPIGILGGTAQFMDALDGGQWQYGDDSVPEVGVTFFAGTFVRHPLTLAAVRAVLAEIKAQGPGLQERLTARTKSLADRLNAVLVRHGVPTKVNHFASVMYFSFPAEERLASLFYYLLREQGVHALEGFPCFMTTEHSDADFDRIVEAFESASIEMRKAGLLEAAKPWTEADELTQPVRDPSAPVPMTEPQREIFLAAVIGNEASCAFNESFSVHFDGPLDTQRLGLAFDSLLARHEALRARVDAEGEHLHIAPQLTIDLPVVDLSADSEADRKAAYDELLAEDARTPFDLLKGPLVRAVIVKMTDRKHILAVTSHHIVCDGWSTNVMLSEMAELYGAALEGRPASLPPAISFSAYATDRARKSTSPEAAAVEAFWLDRFKDAPAAVSLPVDRPRGSDRTSAGTTLHHHIGVERYKRIKALGARNGASLFATLLAGFGTLVGRITNERGITVGLPLAGQSLVEGGNLVGHCVNFLPLRMEVASATPFSGLLGAVKEALLDTYENQSYTYGTLVRRLGIVRDPARLPLTEIQFNVEQIGDGAEFPGLEITVEPNPKGAVNFDMFVNIVERQDGLAIDCDYNTDLFDETTISGWLKAYEELLDAVVARADVAIGEIPLPPGTRTSAATHMTATASELAQIKAWNATSTAFPSDASVIDLFESQVRGSPNAVAVVYGATELTYDQLNRRANQMARAIRKRGAATGGLVALCLPRSAELIVATLAILKAGCGYVPLDASFPRERLELMIGDTKSAVTVTAASVGLSVPGTTNLLVDSEAGVIAGESDANLDERPSPSHLAYVIYTSGSTGRPKGVMVEHRAIVRLVRDTDYCRFGSDEVLLQNAPVSFDAATYEIWGALLNGARLVVMPAGEPSLAELGRMIRDHGITQLFLTTGLFHLMVEQRLDDLGRLRQLMAGGEVLSAKHVQDVVSKLPNTRMIAIYGPTEGTTYSTCHPFPHGATVPASVPIGKPIANARCYVLGEDQRPVPIGALGELYVAGDGLARGYLNNPELTAEKFVTLTLPDGTVERAYRTGDQVRYIDDGSLEFHGRIDGQVKLRGYRIELGEIEAAMLAVPGVRQSCVVPVREDGRVTRIVGFCVPDKKGACEDAYLRQSIGSKLPAYMIPASFVEVDALPLNVNGKIDRTKLLEIATAKRGERLLVAAATPEESTLVAIVAEVMQLDRVGVTENLFEIGVDSLRVFQIASRAGKAGLAITPRSIMKARTIRAAIEEAKNSGAVAPQAMEIKPVSRQRVKLSSLAAKPAETRAK